MLTGGADFRAKLLEKICRMTGQPNEQSRLDGHPQAGEMEGPQLEGSTGCKKWADGSLSLTTLGLIMLTISNRPIYLGANLR